MNKENTEWGVVSEALPNTQFIVQVGDRLIRCYTAGKMKQRKIKVIIGDTVEVVIPTTGEIGRIVWRK